MRWFEYLIALFEAPTEFAHALRTAHGVHSWSLSHAGNSANLGLWQVIVDWY